MTTSTLIVISLVLILAYWLFIRKINSLQRQNKMTLTIGIVWLLFCVGTGLIWGHTLGRVFLDSISTTEITHKQYIIDHSDDIKTTDVDFAHLDDGGIQYKIDTCTLSYWDDITIRDYTDSAYILVWGDRDSWKWRFNKDDGFWVYRENELDSTIFNILDKKKLIN